MVSDDIKQEAEKIRAETARQQALENEIARQEFNEHKTRNTALFLGKSIFLILFVIIFIIAFLFLIVMF